MRKLVNDWRKSGQSMSAYAKRRGVDPQKLWYWRRALGRVRAGTSTPAAVGGAFVPVQVIGGHDAVASVEIVLGDVRVIVRDGASRELVAGVISALRLAC